VCCCGNALAICPWSRVKYRSACLMLKSTSRLLHASVPHTAVAAAVLGMKTVELPSLVGLRRPCRP
jgi:hypothetical protein